MAKCKYCNETDLAWYKDSVTHRFSLIYRDGTAHRCQIQRQEQQQQQQQQQVQQVQPQPQQQSSSTKQISTSEIDRRLTEISANNLSLKEQIARLMELYNDIMQYLVETTRAAKESALASKKAIAAIEEINHLLSVYVSGVELRTGGPDIDPQEEKLADQEFAYDQAKEDGLV